ncbi:hypothetical protein KXX58_004825 [Aspergillus fumigatus]|nr:hypothetical protein KXX58_004825 [Aspergillus fumigatus]KAH2048326.1 hypothetical protein KXW51_006384 [Aspergillus fumigatus]KAH2236013.1 hypothetical protein KXW71_005305 [Aspergillus fumigatus]
MHLSTALFSAIALIAASQVIGASVEVPRDVAAIQIATSPYYACKKFRPLGLARHPRDPADATISAHLKECRLHLQGYWAPSGFHRS